MKEVLVIGIGNRLMMDDGIGVYVVEELKRRNTNSCIRYVIGETDMFFCLDQIEAAEYIIIVDAAFLDKEPGTISTISLEQVLKNSIQPISAHESHLFNEIVMSGKSIKGVFIGIEPHEICYYPNLSTILQEQFIKVVEEIKSIIVSFVPLSPGQVH